jgi:hypothetical protein
MLVEDSFGVVLSRLKETLETATGAGKIREKREQIAILKCGPFNAQETLQMRMKATSTEPEINYP